MTSKKSEQKEKDVTLDEMNVIMRIPERAVAVTVNVTILENGEQVSVSKEMDIVDIRKAREDFLSNVEFGDDYDARFVLTEEGKKYLDEVVRNGY